VDESIKKQLEEIQRSVELSEVLKESSAAQRLMEEFQKNAGITEALKSISTTQNLMDQMKNVVTKIPNFAIEHPVRYGMLEIPEMPKPRSQEEINEYQSASVFMKTLSDEALLWKRQLPKNYRPAILAFLYGGLQIHVNTLSQVSFHGIRIEGTLNGAPCSLLAHQSTVQMLCYGEEISDATPKNPIGFIWSDNKVEV
jgi:hypothetical protein